MKFEEIAGRFVKYFGMSEDAALFAAMCAVGGFTLDAWFFSGGIPPGTVTSLFGAGGYTSYQWLKKRPYFQNRVMLRIDRMVEQGHISKAEGKLYKKKFTDAWARDQIGILKDDDK